MYPTTTWVTIGACINEVYSQEEKKTLSDGGLWELEAPGVRDPGLPVANVKAMLTELMKKIMKLLKPSLTKFSQAKNVSSRGSSPNRLAEKLPLLWTAQ